MFFSISIRQIHIVLIALYLSWLPKILAEYSQHEFTVAVEAGKTECFFKHVKAKHDLEVGYTVIESNSRFDWLLPPHGSSDMRIGFELRSESDEIIHHEEPMPENQYSQTIENEGDYAICLDNRHSTFGSVLVSLELYVYSQNDMNSKWGDDDWDEEYEFTPEEEYNEMVEELKAKLNYIRENITSISHEQNHKRVTEKRDLNVINSLQAFVDYLSILSVTMMVIISCMQVILIRSFFDENSRLRILFTSLLGRR